MLKLYKNIKNRRMELDMSQQELADKIGYTSRTSIAKIEAGEIDLPQSKIVLFANALETTPEALMGWDEPIKTIGYHEPEISPFIDVDALEAKKRREEKKASKQNEENKNDSELDELDKTMLSLFQSLSIIEKCEIITQLKKKST